MSSDIWYRYDNDIIILKIEYQNYNIKILNNLSYHIMPTPICYTSISIPNYQTKLKNI